MKLIELFHIYPGKKGLSVDGWMLCLIPESPTKFAVYGFHTGLRYDLSYHYNYAVYAWIAHYLLCLRVAGRQVSWTEAIFTSECAANNVKVKVQDKTFGEVLIVYTQGSY